MFLAQGAAVGHRTAGEAKRTSAPAIIDAELYRGSKTTKPAGQGPAGSEPATGYRLRRLLLLPRGQASSADQASN
ncbi:hypothetical protein X770_28620 [Mesorhizobium sp. LSJC269B00]|nr:hypothetical protein X770_28620 [Mesorhizobium sp. LSJC269B00]